MIDYHGCKCLITDSQALCIEDNIVKNCSTTTLFHSPFLITAPGTICYQYLSLKYVKPNQYMHHRKKINRNIRDKCCLEFDQ